MKSLTKILILFLLTSCGSSKEEVEDGLKVYNLDQEFPKKELGLEDLMEELELVILETSDESLLPGYFQTIVSDDYIITNDNDKILIFGRDGSFVKQLASKGRGPGEFYYITSWVLTPDQKSLYVAHQGPGDALIVYDLESGGFTTLDYPELPFSMVMLDSEWLLAGGMTRSPYKSYELNIKTGEVRNYVEKEIDDSPAGRVYNVSKIGQDVFFAEVDTLYRLNNGIKAPYLVITAENQFDYATSSGLTSSLSFGITNSSFVTIAKFNQNVERTDGGISSMTLESREFYYFDRESGELFQVDKLKEENTTELYGLAKLQQTGGRLSLIYEAHNWLDMIENSDQIPEQWKEQSKTLDLEDNPVLIIGKAKTN